MGGRGGDHVDSRSAHLFPSFDEILADMVQLPGDTALMGKGKKLRGDCVKQKRINWRSGDVSHWDVGARRSEEVR